jgi:hypothetical protein
VRRADLGFIYAADPKKEQDEIPHAITFKWKSGQFARGECNYDAHTLCVIESPEAGLVDASQTGYYSVNSRSGMATGDIFENSAPPPKNARFGGFRSLSEVGGKAYAVGYRGMVYRLEQLTRWARVDDGLPDDFEIEAIHGFDVSDIYAVGLKGQAWHYDAKVWTKVEVPTNRNLNAVRCTVDGTVYAAGRGGTLIRGRGDQWQIIDHQRTEDDIWDIECFKGDVYLSTLHNVYRLQGAQLMVVDFGEDTPKSCYQLSAASDVMWSNGEYDIMSFDGTNWTRIV